MERRGGETGDLDAALRALRDQFGYWEKTKDLVDQLIDIILNYRQSGHPGGSRSKVHLFLALLLGGAMRFDIRHPEKRFGDRFVLAAGHTIPLVYCTLAVLNESLRIRYEQTHDSRFLIPESKALFWEDLIGFRRRGGLSGHAEASGKTMILAANTGPSGHGAPAAAGIALALKRAGAGEVRVFALEGEGGLTPGSTHETLNSAWGMALDNLHFLVDWNDYGIDDHTVSSVVYGTPEEWFASHGWNVTGTERGSEWGAVTETLLRLVERDDRPGVPGMAWFKTRKGREYLKYDNASHGSPHGRNSKPFWELRARFAEKYGARFTNVGGPAPEDSSALEAEFRANLAAVIEVLRGDDDLVGYLSDRLVEIAGTVPEDVPSFKLARSGRPFDDSRIFDFRSYPPELYVEPGTRAANRTALARWGAWVNAYTAGRYDRPLVIAASADLAGSTNLKGFADSFGDFPGYGWYERVGSADGVLLPTEITEFSNAAMLAAAATVNLDRDPERHFDGFWGAVSTYGSFSYLKYGPLRLFSQYAQDTGLAMGKLLWIAGHSGPETADDSRTHFGIFSPGVTQLFPRGRIINLHPWEHNEVPVLLGAALSQSCPLVALHLTRPEIEVPDRAALGIPSHFEAARGAYVIREYDSKRPPGGTVFVQGTSAVHSIVQLLPTLEEEGPNVRVVCAVSSELFALQPAEYRRSIAGEADRADSTVITTQARGLMRDWIFNDLAEEYALSSDFDDRWRSGGTLAEVIDEARLSPEWVLEGLRRFAADRDERLRRLRAQIDAAERRGRHPGSSAG